ncbi:uncharacterized protein [Linepithema humile]|uniref:uncharacterized protein n=1 Tax=Linepithema humile TaxID=83485 RepID=UPI00351DD5C4
MAKSIRPILSPLLSISYMCGLRIIEFPAGNPRIWFSFLYILLLWPAYCFTMINKLLSYICNDSFEYRIYIFLNTLMTLLSMLLAIYHDKKFRNCLKKLAIVDDTLEKIGIMTNYQELSKKITRIVLGWSVIALLLNCSDYIRWRDYYDVLTSICLTFMMNFCSHVNIINDLIFASILGYIGLKFDHINEHLHKLTTETKRASGSLVLHQRGLLNVPTSKYITWIIIHLHLELHRISLEINSIFEVEMTFKMVCYFGIIAEFLRQFFSTLFIRHYVAEKAILITIIVIFWLAWYIVRLFIINYICEKVSAKANATGDFINRISHFTCNVEIRENILQFFFQITQAPLRFHGFQHGFQFGSKFFYRYFESILALIILLIQADRFKHVLKNY